eukprot:c12474_g1_i2.p1 GENE.c12474_g1_i2~~c12474_g1_i2.p1  ORF type:complete len:182 (+),score=81.01 c12474_g1_i2:40-546(+)
MRCIIQRVLSGRVLVAGEIISSIKNGLVVFVGIHQDDTQEDVDYMVRKLLNLRVFESSDGKMWQKSITDLNYELLLVSNFTLYATLKGNKPDYHLAMKTDPSKELYQSFVQKACSQYKKEFVKDGQFGAHMQVEITNDGPVTLQLDSPEKKKSQQLNNKTVEETSTTS